MTETNRRVVALDNTGTLSTVIISVAETGSNPVFDSRVPDIPRETPAALVGLGVEELDVFDNDGTLAETVAENAIPVHLALSNVETTAAQAREALLTDETTAARTITREAAALRERLHREHPKYADLPIGIQVAVALEDGGIHRVIAYTTVPRPEAADVVVALKTAGWEVHLVSGDREHVLEPVAAVLGIESDRVHSDCSAADKARTVRALRNDGAEMVAMVGDYVNDAAAFEAADRSILIAETSPDPDLSAIVDVVVESLEAVPDVL